ncbi:MAG: hypothetical protein IT376_03765 [Polyangiaceae bacterium]|nr:hypothetical protein [Polyangiaceae bacterium]
MKLAFFGLPLAACLLASDGHELAVATLAPVPGPGRRRLARVAPGAVVIDALATEDLEGDVDAALRSAGADLVVSWFWTRLLPARWLSAPLGAIGVHPSLLPRHRGPDPYFAAIDAGDPLTGVTVHRLEAEYDTGAILGQRTLPVGDRDAWQLARALDRPSLALLREVVGRLARGERLAETRQPDGHATWAPRPTGDALRVDWRWPTERVLRRVRALAPVPGLALELGGTRFYLTAAARAPASALVRALAPGEAAAEAERRLLLRTGDGALVALAGVTEDGEPLGQAALAALAPA